MPSVNRHQQIDTVPPEFQQFDQPTQARIREFAATVAPMRLLKRSGQRPMLFNGATLATICGVTPSLPFWYELNVHRTVLDTYLSDIRLFHKSPDEPDLFWVSEHDDLDALVAHFERYHPAADLTPPALAPDRASAAELALWAAGLQLRVEQITQHYRALVGELLHAVHAKPA